MPSYSQAPYPQVVCPGFLVMIWKARDSGCVVLTVSPDLAWWVCACFGCAFLYLLGAVSSLLLHPVPPLWTFKSTLPVLGFLIWVSYGAAHRYLSCANPGAVNTYHSPKPLYLAVPSGVPSPSSHFLSIYASSKCITALCNRAYLPNSRDFPLSLYCLMAPDRAFWREETWILSCFVMLEHHNCQRYMLLYL